MTVILFLILSGTFTFLIHRASAFGGKEDDRSTRVGSRGLKSQPLAGENFLNTAKLTADDGAANDSFGVPSAIDGTTAVVGGGGKVYVYVKSGAAWAQQQKLTPSDGAPGTYFGNSVAIDGDTLVVGAFGGTTAQGSAYVFVRSGTTWAEQQKIVASDGGIGDGFGFDVAINGDSFISGSPLMSSIQGAAYVFVRSTGVWAQQQKLTAADGAAGDRFGYDVAIDGDTALIGAVEDDVTFGDEGSAYVFLRTGAAWAQQQKLIAADGAGGDGFGNAVGISGNSVIVGAPFATVSVLSQGAAYVFVRSGATWTQQQKLTAPDAGSIDFLGFSVGISGDTVIAGADEDDIISNMNQGSAYVFVRTGTAWAPPQKLVAPDGAANDRFGSTVAVDGPNAIVGAFFDDIGANANQGSAYIFERPLGTPYTFSYTGPATNIPDNAPAGVNIPFTVPGPAGAMSPDAGAQACTIADLNFRFDGTQNGTVGATNVGVTHSWVGDLQLRLTSPTGTTVLFFDRPWFVTGGFGCGNNNLAAITLDEDVTSLLVRNQCTGSTPNGTTGAAFPSGTFSPDNALSAFDGQNAVGTWTLNASDLSSIDTGTVRAFSLVFSCVAPPTASGVTVSGRVTALGGRGVTNAVVSITDANGVTRNTVTQRLGQYVFDDVEPGQTYLVSVRSRRFTFSPRVVNVNDNIADLDFVEEGGGTAKW